MIIFVFAAVDNSVGSYLIKDNGTTDRFGNAINVGDLVKDHGLGGAWLVSNANIKYDLFSDGSGAVNVSAKAEGADRAFVGNWTDYPTAWNYSVSYITSKRAGDANREAIGIGFYNKTSGRYLGIRYRGDQSDLQWSPSDGTNFDCNAVAVGLGLSTAIGTVYNITLNYRNISYVGCNINGTPCATNCSLLSGGFGFDSIYGYSELSTEIQFGNIRVYNGTSFPQTASAPSDTTPPEILVINMTSDGGTLGHIIFPSSNWTYIEKDVHTQAGVIGTWVSPTNAFDQNFDTFASATAIFDDAVFINYTLGRRPLNLKDEFRVSTDAVSGIVNVSCYNYTGTKWLNISQIPINSDIRKNETVPLDCYSDTSQKVQLMFIGTAAAGTMQVYEDKMWYVTSPRTNDTTPTFSVITNEAATCAVIDNNRNLNWTDIFAGNANNDAGAPSTTHTLTLNDTNATGSSNFFNLSIGCKDSTGNENSTSTSGKFFIYVTNTKSPNVTIFKPVNNSVFGNDVNLSGPMQFNFSARDDEDDVIPNCTLYIDNVFQFNKTNYANSTLFLANISYNSTGSHFWNVNCTDTSGNVNTSQVFNFSITTVPKAVNMTLFLNETHANKSYEFDTFLLDKDYGVGINISSPGTQWCLDYDYMINWTCGSGNTFLRINLTELNITKFSNDSTINLSVNTDFSNVIYQDVELAAGCHNLTVISQAECGKAFDENLATGTDLADNYNVTENFTIPNNLLSANWTLKYRARGFIMNNTCWNGSEYIEIFSSSSSSITTNTTIIPQNCLTVSILQFVTKFNVTSTGIIDGQYFEGNVTFFRSEPSRISIPIDNNTDLVNVSFKLRGYPLSDSYPKNVTADLNKDNIPDIIIPGLIKEDKVVVNDFILNNEPNKRAANLTFPTAGSKPIFINMTTLFAVKNITIPISGYNIDEKNIFNYTEKFNTTNINVNYSLSYKVDSLGILDNFVGRTASGSNTDENDTFGKWNASTAGDPNVNPWMRWTTDANGVAILQYRNGGHSAGATVYANYISSNADFRNSSYVSFYFNLENTCNPNQNAHTKLQFWDKYSTNPATDIYEIARTDCGPSSTLSDINYRNITMISGDGTNWNIYSNSTFVGTASTSSLNDSVRIGFRFKLYAVDNSGAIPVKLDLYKVEWSGAWLNYSTLNGTYTGSGNFTSGIVQNTTDNLQRILITPSVYNTQNTSTKIYVSNVCNQFNPPFELASFAPTVHVFGTTGKYFCWRAELNSTENLTSPIVRRMKFEVITGTSKNISVDAGNDGTIDWIWEFGLNDTTSPKIINISGDACTNYSRVNCAGQKTCLCPLSIRTGSPGTIGINGVNLSQYILSESNGTFNGEITLTNLSSLENINNFNWTFVFTNGIINIYDLDIEFRGSKNISIFLHSIENSSTLLSTSNVTLRIFYSKFNQSFPKGISKYSLIYPKSAANLNESNVTVLGQKFGYCNTSVDSYCVHSSTPIYNITSRAYDLPIDVYLFANQTINRSINHSFDTGVNRTSSLQIKNQSALLIISNLSNQNSKGIFSFVDFFNMTRNLSKQIDFNYNFKFRTYCNECVR